MKDKRLHLESLMRVRRLQLYFVEIMYLNTNKQYNDLSSCALNRDYGSYLRQEYLHLVGE